MFKLSSTTHFINVEEGDVLVPKPSTYPFYYTIGMDNTFRVGQTNITDKLKAMITFTDFDLISGHQLLLFSMGTSNPISISTTKLSDLSDLLVDLPLYLNLTSHSIVSARPPFLARGFKAILEAISCGVEHIVKNDEPLILAIPTSLSDEKIFKFRPLRKLFYWNQSRVKC